MNYPKLGIILGKIMILESVLMLAPLAVALFYRESYLNIIAFIIPIVLLAAIGVLLQFVKCKRNTLYQKEGFALTSTVWIVLTLFGALPFVINGEIPNYINACFEIMSGFTTTGASIVTDITTLSHSSLFWRSFSHWIGGMGVLVFVLIFIPESNEGSSMHLLRAESPGPQVGKIASKMKVNARILYLIYLGLTVIEVIILLLCKPIPGYESDHFFISLLTTFGCAGTGGFGFLPGSMELFSPLSQYIIAIFLVLFGCNFSLYYLILIGKLKTVLKSEEFKCYFIIIAIAVLIIFLNLNAKTNEFISSYSTEEAFRHAFFQVASIMTTTGYSSTDFGVWPMASCMVLLITMFIGAMAGSTSGGIKLSRIIIAVKGIYINIRKLINPRYVSKTKFEQKNIEEKTTSDIFSFISLYMFIMIFSLFLLSFDPANGQTSVVQSDLGEYTVTHGFLTNFSATVSCLSNIGPGFEAIGPYLSFVNFSYLSKILLILEMLMGRLEILPVLILFSPKTWKKI